MELQTHIELPPTRLRLSHDRNILLVGSCFTQAIGNRLHDCGFRVLVNPFGILYNPISIAECLRRCRDNQMLEEDELTFYNGQWHSWLHHGCFSSESKELCLAQINERISEAHKFLMEGCDVILTLGTAFAYFLKSGAMGMIPVANCHKIPSSTFEKRLLSIQEITNSFQVLNDLTGNVILTLSPIRHTADGMHGNQVSKATLLLAINKLIGGEEPSCQVVFERKEVGERSSSDGRVFNYFPSYEILMDELRDYRFYGTDMVHPSPVAEEIIWERFQSLYMTEDTRNLGARYYQLHQMEQHRPLFPESEAYKKHLQKTEQLRNELNKYTIK